MIRAASEAISSGRMTRLLCLALLFTACASGKPAPPVEAKQDGPPPGIGRRDNATTLGPYTGGPLTVSSHLSAEYSATVNSWILAGPTELGVIDTQLVMPEAEKVVALIKQQNKKLAWVWITHAHPDHHAGLEAIAAAFPGVPLLAHPRTVENAPAILKKFDAPLQKFFPGEMAKISPALTPHTGETLTLDGVEIRIHVFEGGEHDLSTALEVPALKALFIADLVYNNVHPWLNELDTDTVLAHVDRLAAMPNIETFYPGHGEPFKTDYLPVYTAYVKDFLAEVPQATDAGDLVNRVWRRHPDWRTMAGLRFSASAHIDARKSAQPKP